jgi:hypothetical protein
MGYWVCSEPEHFLEGMYIMEKYYFIFSHSALTVQQNYIE